MPLAMEHSETAIGNRSLSLIRAGNILSIENDTGAAAIELRLKFAPVRNFLQRNYLWNCTEEQAQLGALAEKPKFKWTVYAQLPADCLFVREVYNAGREDWKVVSGKRLAAKIPAPLQLIYSREVLDPSEWDAAFQDAMVKSLAAEIAPRLSESETIIRKARADAAAVLKEAKAADAAESSGDALPDGSWAEAMLGGEDFRARPVTVIE